MGNEVKSGSTTNSQSSAQSKVNSMKSEWGDGVSSKIMVNNNTSGDLYLIGKDSYSGRFDYDPPDKIASKGWGAWLHVKKSSTACGSTGVAVFGNKRQKPNFKVYIGWNSPYSGTNTAGMEIFEGGSGPKNQENITYQTSDTKTCDPDGLSITGQVKVTSQNATGSYEFFIYQE
eukprot:399831_1